MNTSCVIKQNKLKYYLLSWLHWLLKLLEGGSDLLDAKDSQKLKKPLNLDRIDDFRWNLRVFDIIKNNISEKKTKQCIIEVWQSLETHSIYLYKMNRERVKEERAIFIGYIPQSLYNEIMS